MAKISFAEYNDSCKRLFQIYSSGYITEILQCSIIE